MAGDNARAVRRVHIIGGGGSGKTTLARALASRLGVPTHDLDEVAYEGGAGPARPLEARLADIRRISTQEAWITEGVYLWWVDDLMRSADVVIWLDVPFRVAAWRIIARHVRLTLAGTNRFPGWWRLLRFLHWTWDYHHRPAAAPPADLMNIAAVTRATTRCYLLAYRVKVRRCRSSHEVQRLLHELNSWG